MGEAVIQAVGLGKQYRIGGRRERSNTLRDTLTNALVAPFWRVGKLVRGQATGAADLDTTIWALKDVSFEVKYGEVVGIIGRNGAGKSTLLKILSCITEPTEGYARVRGRVGALLEVGTGFHSELTGRENIYLSGAILGMKKRVIDRRLDEIVAFAEVEKFVDTPVKHYSSGMYLRLAFAVAAHLEPEILLVDEVLAVGDAAFQRKCLGKMDDVAKQGRTVLFVSHNMAAVRSLCSSGCLLENGCLVLRATADECVKRYLAQDLQSSPSPTASFAKPPRSPWMTCATLLCNGQPSTSVHMGDLLTLEVSFAADPPIQTPGLGFVISTASGDRLLNANNHYQQSRRFSSPVRQGRIRCELGMIPLMAGRYFVSLWFGGDHIEDTHVVKDALAFDVIEHDIWGQGRVPPNISFLWWPVTFHLMPKTENPW